ncbi:MAG: hypothetical protein Q8O03_01895, partial [Nanoarchaeota archaeon]|nr:hypothetical protein [Nanoarchaeota archaeon]
DHEIWIKARLIEDEPISIIYFADPPECWEAILADRIIYHFEIFKLIELYGSHAAEEISNIELISRAIFRSTGKQGLKEYLELNVESHRRNRNNSWQTALYRCLSESEFYCNQRFNENG